MRLGWRESWVHRFKKMATIEAPTPVFPVPRRQYLLAEIASANRWGRRLLWIQAALVVALLLLIDWRRILQAPWTSVFAVAVIVGPFFMELLRYWAQQKKEIGDLKEQTRFGQFDKHQLRTLFQDTLRKLKLPPTRVPVFVVADKFMNAAMLHVGLGAVFKSLNGIYLNRQALHKFTPEEVQDIMGHELGHYYCYYLVTDRFRLIPLALGALAGVYAIQVFGLESLIGTLVLFSAASVVWTINQLLTSRHIQAIEFLCDDLGAHVNGVAVSISGLMKLGAEWEVLTAIQQQAAVSNHRGNLTALELSEAIAAAVPYGHATREEIEAAVQKSLKLKAAQGPSLGGFLHYMWNSDVDATNDEEFELQMKKLAKLQLIPRIPWEKLLANPQQIKFDERSVEALVELIEQFPQAALFHTPEAIGETDPTHPPLKQRILYLWRNRTAIQGSASSRSSLLPPR